ncbi:helix-turn-helix domain-containing protein [Thermodesulfobacteriota bacterium]
MSEKTIENVKTCNARRMAPLLRVTDTAPILGVSPKTVHKLVREGKLSCVQITCRERRFTEEQVQDFIQSQTGPVIRVDKNAARPVQSTSKKGGEKSSGVSRAEFRKELRSWL